MGEVFLAHEPATGSEWALKRLRGVAPDGLTKLRREFEALVQVRHPAVVRVVELGTTSDEVPFLLLDYVPGLPVDQVLVPGDWDALCFMCARVCEGLEALHANHVVHGDLKPSNILVIPNATGDQYCLVDFGLAALRGRPEDGSRGTWGFAAPEVIEGAIPSPAADLFGLGATLYTLGTGVPLDRTSRPGAEALERLGAPPRVVEIILRLLAPLPGDRFATAEQVRHEVERACPAARISLAKKLQSSRFVGRRRELAQIGLRLRTERPSPSINFVTGEVGSGVTSLLLEITNRAMLAGRTVITRSSIASRGQSLVAELESRIAALAGEANLAGLAGADLLRTVLRKTGRPLVVVLDDVEFLDDEASAWFRSMALGLKGEPITWFLGQASVSLEPWIQLIVDAGRAHQIRLRPLSTADLSDLLTVRLGCVAPPALVDAIRARTQGQPGPSLEFLHELVAAGAVAEYEHGLLFHLDHVPVPSRISDFERSRLQLAAELAGAERSLIAALAICGPAISSSALAQISPAPAEALARLMAKGLVRVEGDLVLMQPPSLQQHVAALLSEDERTDLHRRALEQLPLTAQARFWHLSALDRVEDALAAAATALAEGAPVSMAMAAAELADARAPQHAEVWHEHVAESYRKIGKYRAAVPHLRQALRAAISDERKSHLTRQLSNALLRAGMSNEVVALLEERPSAPVYGFPLAHLRANASAAHALMGQEERAAAEAGRALQDGDATSDPLACGIAAEVMLRLAFLRGDADQADVWAGRARDHFRRVGNMVGVIRALGSRAAIARLRGNLDVAIERAQAAVVLAREEQIRLALSEQLMAAAAIQVERGEWTQARELCREALRLALEDAREVEAATAMLHLGQIEGLLGRPRAAWRCGRRGMTLALKHHRDLESYARRTLAQAERLRGHAWRALRQSERALTAATRGRSDRLWCGLELGRAFAELGNWQKAHGVWENALEGVGHDLPALLLRIFAARANLRLKARDAAERLADEVGRVIEERPLPILAAHHRLLRAELAIAAGRNADGKYEYDRAIEVFTKLHAPAEVAQAALDVSLLLELESSRAEALALAEAAKDGFARLGNRRGRERALARAFELLQSTAGERSPGGGATMLEQVSLLVSSISDRQEFLDCAMRIAVEQLHAERGVLLLYDVNGELVPAAEYGAVESATRVEAAGYSSHVVEQATRGGDAILIVDAEVDPRAVSNSIDHMRLRSILCTPLYVERRAIGAVYLDDSRRAHAFAETDRRMVEAFGHLIAQGIERGRRHEQIQNEKDRLESENLALVQAANLDAKRGHDGIIGTSPAMMQVLERVRLAARTTDTTVLITGENGTGKELIALALHRQSRRAKGPLLTVNCGAFPDQLIESELFGIGRNVATGVGARIGKFVQADGGTLFLDEIGDMPPAQQVALLTAISRREVTPVGGNRPVPVDVRIIAATNRNLQELVRAGRFREDLYYRLNVIRIDIPPLRERRQDIPELTRHFLKLVAQKEQRPVPQLSPKFMPTLVKCEWPGNVRQLQNYVESIFSLSDDYLVPDPAPEGFLRERETNDNDALPVELRTMVEQLERKLIGKALETSGGHKSDAARLLGLTEQSLRYRMKSYAISINGHQN